MKRAYELAVALLGILDKKKAIEKALDYFETAFNASNITLYLGQEKWQRFENPQYSPFEQKIMQKLSEERIISVGTTPPQLSGNYIAIPLIKNKTAKGALFIYSMQELKQEAEQLATSVEILQKALHGLETHENVEEKAIHDSLTGLYNREYFSWLVKDKLNGETSIAILDIDNFKNYNDTKGHLEGDKLLKEIADKIKNSPGIVCRYGGEEFALHLNMSPKQALATMEELRKHCQGERTVSIGLATKLEDNAGYADMLQEADKALYKAKNQGKNKVIQHVMISKNLVIDVQQAAEMGR